MKIQTSSVTLWLIAVCVVVFIIQQFTNITDALSFTPATALSQPWTFVTAIFLHASITHILFNMLALFFFGIYLERRISKRSFILIFFLAGIIGNIWYMLTSTDPMISALGASGAIYGIMGTLAVLEPKSTVFVYGIPMPMFAAAIVWFGLNFFGLLGPDIGYGAHIGGLVFGIAAGFYFRFRLRRNVLIFKQTY
jgi:membrane associated rhomboid family serine protease